MTIALYSVIFGLLGRIFVQAFSHRLERKDLYNRIMSKDIHEYNVISGENAKPKARSSPHKRSLKKWRNIYKADVD